MLSVAWAEALANELLEHKASVMQTHVFSSLSVFLQKPLHPAAQGPSLNPCTCSFRARCLADIVNSGSSGVQLPAVAQLQLPSSQPAQAAASQTAKGQQALTQAHEALMQQSIMAAAAAAPAGAPGGPELPGSSGLGHGQPTAILGMQEHLSAKQHMLHAISDGAAMVQVECSVSRN